MMSGMNVLVIKKINDLSFFKKVLVQIFFDKAHLGRPGGRSGPLLCASKGGPSPKKHVSLQGIAKALWPVA